MDCKHEHTNVLDSRKQNDVVVRRRHCKDCGRKWTTAEIEIDNSKKDGDPIEAIKNVFAGRFFDADGQIRRV